jgi:Uma2 family endonuclease
MDAHLRAGYHKVMSSVVRRKMTYADLEKIPPDLNRHEILEGEWYRTPAPSPDHQTVVGNLYRILVLHVRARKLGRVFVAPLDVLLSRHNVLEPDVLFISTERLAIIKKKYARGAPDLVIEVGSPSTVAVDRSKKLDIYGRRGVREYWIVDLFARTVEVHEFGRRPRLRIHQEEQTFETDLLPGLGVSVSDVFEI